MRFNYYRRDGTVCFGGVHQWAEEFQNADRTVAKTTVSDGKWISTVFLGLDHQFGDGHPLIFETMVFPSKDDMGELDCRRYSSEDEAKAGHEEMVKKWSE